MAAKSKKNEIFFVRETPDSYIINWSQTKPISKREMERRLKESKKTAKTKKAE
ncbi:MAG: hypothetical protein ACHQVK_01505 [Candidatus Paceibacterales bacterium]